MTRATTGGPVILPPGQIADPLDAGHVAPIFSTAKEQTTPSRLVTRRTPVNFGVCCLIDLTQRQAVARAVAPGFDCPPPAWADDDLNSMEIDSLRERSDLMQRPAG